MSADQAKNTSSSDTRSRILDATEQIMLEEGYAGVSSRKVATRAGLKSKLVHYYFRTMDDLFIAAFQRREDYHVARFAAAAASNKPLQELWALAVDAASSKLYLEFNALACHRPLVREVIARSNSRDRNTVAAALESVFSRYGMDREKYPPKVVAMAMAGMARAFATDRALGTEDGHSELLDFVGQLLDDLEKTGPQKKASRLFSRKVSRTEKEGAENYAPSQLQSQQQENMMLSINELELEHLPIETAEFGNNPLPFFDRARRKHEWLAASDIGYVVTGYHAIDKILRLDDKLKMPGEEIVDIMGAHGTGWGDFAVDQMLVASGERHARLRGSISAAFTPANVNRLRSIMSLTISEILDEWAPKGAFDFAEFAAQFPVRIMFSLLGTPIDRLPEIIESLEIHGESFNLEVEKMSIIEEAYQKLWRFVDGLIGERLEVGEKDDLLDTMIAANRGGQISDKELRQLLVLSFAAGYDTTKNLLTLLMNSMLQYPEIYRRCGEDFDYTKKVVKEQLRFATPSNTMRIVTETIEYQDVVIPEGTMLFFPLTLSGRDPAAFSEPMKFNPDRTENNSTLGFGRGMHICLGKFLAVANVEEGIHQIAKRIINPRPAGDAEWKLFPGVWGIIHLPIEFDLQPPVRREAG